MRTTGFNWVKHSVSMSSGPKGNQDNDGLKHLDSIVTKLPTEEIDEPDPNVKERRKKEKKEITGVLISTT